MGNMTSLVRMAASWMAAASVWGSSFHGLAESLPAPKAAADGSYEVKTLLFAELSSKSRPGRSLPVRVHYPDAQGSWPVVVFSHGGGGNLDSNYAQARHLATHGYVVCCVEHTGSNAERIRSKLRIWDSLRDMTRDPDEVLGRPVDIKEVLDQVELWNGGHDELWGKFDLAHVAVIGHSFGAYTALAVCGARPALDWLERGPVESLKPDKDFLRSRVGKGLGPDLSDRRVDVGVALSPQGPGEPFFLEESYASIDRPVLGISGSEDRQQGAAPENRKRFVELTPSPGTLLLWLHGADHLAFSDPVGSGQVAVPSPSREWVQPVSRAATLYFLDAHLKGRKGALAMITGAALGPIAGKGQEEVEVLRRAPASGSAAQPEATSGPANAPQTSPPLHLRDLFGGLRRR